LLVCRAGCSQAEIIRGLRGAGLWGGETDYDRKYTPPPQDSPGDKEKRIEKAERMWEEALPIQPGDPVHRYLTGRGIVLDAWPDDLHYHPALPYWTADDNGKPVKIGTFPAMLAVVRNLQGRPVSLHRTYITSDGHKAPVESPKKLFKVHDLTGSAVCLFPPRDGILGLAEGTETALSAYLLTGTPTWAALSAGGIERAELPEEIKRVVIFADNDRSKIGQRAAAKVAIRFRSEGREARILVPDELGKDFNDILQKMPIGWQADRHGRRNDAREEYHNFGH
jgi:putative DNA primase/helicase